MALERVMNLICCLDGGSHHRRPVSVVDAADFRHNLVRLPRAVRRGRRSPARFHPLCVPDAVPGGSSSVYISMTRSSQSKTSAIR